MNQVSQIRLNKRLVELGLAPSRRAADQLIIDKKVKLNGQIITTLATFVDQNDTIKVGRSLGQEKSGEIIIAFNKPAGYVCTHKGQGAQKTIYELLPKNFASLKCVGRLDKDSQGLLILTSNGHLVQQLSHPSSGKEKEYLVTTQKPLSKEQIQRLRAGISIEGKPHTIKSIKSIRGSSYRLVLVSGLNRQIRRSFEAINSEVIKLERTRFGGYSLNVIPEGKYRFISESDLL